MRNRSLAADYIKRAAVRLRVIDALYEAGSWADVVRESQEAVELALKGLLRTVGIDPPHVHDVADVLEAERSQLPTSLADDVDRFAAASRALRRDYELAFDGAEDLIPSEFYREPDAQEARSAARFVVERVCPHVTAETSG